MWCAYNLRLFSTPDLFHAPILAQVVSADEAAPVTLQDQSTGRCLEEESSRPLADAGPRKSSVPYRVQVVSHHPAQEAVSSQILWFAGSARAQPLAGSRQRRFRQAPSTNGWMIQVGGAAKSGLMVMNQPRYELTPPAHWCSLAQPKACLTSNGTWSRRM